MSRLNPKLINASLLWLLVIAAVCFGIGMGSEIPSVRSGVWFVLIAGLASMVFRKMNN